MTRESFWSRVTAALRRNGIRGVVVTAFRRSVYRRVILIQRDLSTEIVQPPCDVPIRVSVLKPGDAGAYARFRPEGSPDGEAAQFRRESACYAAWHDDRIVAAAWYHPGEAWIEDIGRRFQLPKDEMYVYDAATLPELRGQSVAPARSAIALVDLRDNGFKRVVAYVLAENPPGLRSTEKSGWRRFGEMAYLKLGAARIDFVRIDGEPTRWRFRRMPRAPRASLPPLEPESL